jgi:hypothetical protein
MTKSKQKKHTKSKSKQKTSTHKAARKSDRRYYANRLPCKTQSEDKFAIIEDLVAIDETIVARGHVGLDYELVSWLEKLPPALLGRLENYITTVDYSAYHYGMEYVEARVQDALIPDEQRLQNTLNN